MEFQYPGNRTDRNGNMNTIFLNQQEEISYLQ